MNDEILAHMKERMRQVRRIIEMAHDPEMIGILRKIVESGEADIARLEAEQRAPDG
jgi:hypothetical protein